VTRVVNRGVWPGAQIELWQYYYGICYIYRYYVVPNRE